MRRSWRYVTLDATGTLLRPAEPTGETYLRFWERALGHRLSTSRRTAAVAALSDRFLGEFRALSAEKPNFGADNGASTCAYRWWHELVLNVMASANVVENVPEEVGERFTRDLYGHFASPQAWTVFSDVLPALETLKERDVSMAVISNFDERLETLLVGLGLRGFFQVVTTSFRDSHVKPDAAIFLKTFKRLKASNAGDVDTSEFLHVGDHPKRDYQAAVAIGAQARLVWRSAKRPPPVNVPSEDVVATLRDIAEETKR